MLCNMWQISVIVSTLIAVTQGATWAPTWTKGSAATDEVFSLCKSYTQLWSYSICVIDDGVEYYTEAKQYVANVVAQIIDSTYSGTPDDQTIADQCAKWRCIIMLTNSSAEESDTYQYQQYVKWLQQETTKKQTHFIQLPMGEVQNRSCETPDFRNVSGETRDQWTSWITSTKFTPWTQVTDDTADDYPGYHTDCTSDDAKYTKPCIPCNTTFGLDAAPKAAIKLIYGVAAELFPVVWGGQDGRSGTGALSDFGTAIGTINGNCGYGYKVNYVDPSSGGCTGYFSIADDTCMFDCIAAEAVYLGLKSYLGSQMSSFAIEEVKSYWTLNYPDSGMAKGTVSEGKEMSVVSSSFYAMMQPTSSNIERRWQPQIWPNGTYTKTPPVTASASTTKRTGVITYAEWWTKEGKAVMEQWDLDQQTLLYDPGYAQKIAGLGLSLYILASMVYAL